MSPKTESRLRAAGAAAVIASAAALYVHPDSGLAWSLLAAIIGVRAFGQRILDACGAFGLAVLQSEKTERRNNARDGSYARPFDDRFRQYPVASDFDLTHRLIEAIRDSRIAVHYQPIIDANTLLPAGIEALARWHDDKHGWVSPALFIPMAEKLGMIQAVGRQVMKHAFRDFSSNPIKDGMCVAMNISHKQLFSRTFFRNLNETLTEHGLKPKQVKLEITESADLGSKSARAYLNGIAEAGFYLSLDDFGAGSSSLSQLHEIAVREVKIDKSYVQRVKFQSGRTYVKTIVDTGHALNLAVVAEGVEDEETAKIMRDLGVEMLQGHYFRRSAPHDECHRYMLEQMPAIRHRQVKAPQENNRIYHADATYASMHR